MEENIKCCLISESAQSFEFLRMPPQFLLSLATFKVNRQNRLRIVLTHFKSCDHTLGTFHSDFGMHDPSCHGTKYVEEIKRYFIKRL